MAAQVEQDHLGTPFGLAAQRFDDGALDRMVGLGCGQDAFGARKQHAGGEALVLRIGRGFDQVQFLQVADQRRHAVVAQAAGVEARRREGAAQRVHLGQRRQMRGVAEVVGELAARQAGAGGRLHRHDAALLATAQLLADEGEGDAGEVAAATGAADDDVGVVPGHLQLQHGLLADDGLVHQHVVEHRTQRVLGVVVGGGHFHRFADGNAQRAGVIGVLRQDGAASCWSAGWGWRGRWRRRFPSARGGRASGRS
jgi:hypothetical protein